MINNVFFNLILIILTIFTGIFWIFNKSNIFLRIFYKEIFNHFNKIPFWIESISSYFPTLLLVFCFRSFIYEPFQIPSGSMIPALLPGDFILVEKFTYGIKNPITQKTLISAGKPNRGDLVVFRYPHDNNLFYIKRVIGLPGDFITYDLKNKSVNVYPNCYNKSTKTCITKNNLIDYSNVLSNDFVKKQNNILYHYYNEFLDISVEKKTINGLRLSIHNESFNKLNYFVLLNDVLVNTEEYYHQNKYHIGNWLIPKGKYFMMGDNRDNSLDSRYWGFVSELNLVGKAIIIWMSYDFKNNFLKNGIRIERIGKIN